MNYYRIFEFASYLIDFYLLIISLRILLSWFGGNANFQGMQLLRNVTDPYLNFFRGVKFLRLGFLDLSPLLGIFLLFFFSSLFRQFAAGRIGFNIGLAVLAQTLVMGVSSIFALFALITLVRIVGLFLKASSVEELWFRMDGFLQPLVLRFVHLFAPGQRIPYGSALGLFMAACFLVSLLLRMLLGPLVDLILRIPF